MIICAAPFVVFLALIAWRMLTVTETDIYEHYF